MHGRLRRPYWLGLFVLAACFPIRDLRCTWCEHELSEGAREKIAADEAKGIELLGPWIAERGEYLHVHDDALGVDWIAIEPGVAALKWPQVSFPDHAHAFAIHYKMEARRSDAPTDDPREIEMSFTMVPGPSGPTPLAVTLRSVGPDRKQGGPTQERRFYSCPTGDIHYSTWAAGESPCHHVPLVPLVKCGCSDSGTYSDPNECARFDRDPTPLKDCRKAEGEPIPP